MKAPQDLTGRRFGRLIATRYSHQPKTSKLRSAWFCVCDCGKEKLIQGSSLTSGDTTSCGCFRNETTIKRTKTHGMRHTPEYESWYEMLRRCCDPKRPEYPYYGGRGITVCKRWQTSFTNFYSDMGARPSSKHSIDRRNNSRGYTPKNCYWATSAQQSRNTRRNHIIKYKGTSKCITDWAIYFGFKPTDLVNEITVKRRTMSDAVKRLRQKTKPRYVRGGVASGVGDLSDQPAPSNSLRPSSTTADLSNS